MSNFASLRSTVWQAAVATISALVWALEASRSALDAQVKRPGEELVSMPATLTAVENAGGEVDAYERLLDDAMHGDSMLFVREDAVEAAWAIVEPVLESTSPLYPYAPSSWGPQEADRLADDLGGWHNPERPSQ